MLVRCIDILKQTKNYLWGSNNTPTCVILYYHVVRPEYRERFSRQLDDLLRFANPISADSRINTHGGNHYAAVTFDDGYASILENALPEMMKRNIPFTIFVPTGCLGHHPPWIHRGSEEYSEIVMTAEQLGSLDTNVVSIGSHCITHRNLLELTPDEANREILDSKIYLENILNKTISSISFPHGAFDQSHIQMARNAGYECAFSILPQLNDLNGHEFIKGRVRIDPTDWRFESQLKMLGAYRWLTGFISFKKQILHAIVSGQSGD